MRSFWLWGLLVCACCCPGCGGVDNRAIKPDKIAPMPDGPPVSLDAGAPGTSTVPSN